MTMLMIDGSQGEGGGQVLRTSLSLSALTGKGFRIDRIRANRSKPGLRPQHLTAVRAVAALCNAELDGDALNSTCLTFRPGSPPREGEYTFDVSDSAPGGRSAGSVTLILQAILWPLLFARSPSTVTLQGGTFVPFSPPYHYLSEVTRPAFSRFGIDLDTRLAAWGWMSEGGGEMVAHIRPAENLASAKFHALDIQEVKGVAAVTNLPSHIPHRMARRAYNLLTEAGFSPDINPVRERGAGPGAGIVLWLSQGGFSSLGRKGLPADKVAESAVAELKSFVGSGAAVDSHLADQLLMPMALAHGRSMFTTDRLTSHAMTNIALLRQWLELEITVKGKSGGPGEIQVNGVGWQRS